MRCIFNVRNLTAVAVRRQLSGAVALLIFLMTGSQGIANPAYSHVVVVVEENHGYSDIIGNGSIAPYINNTLASGGIVLTNAYGEQHPSQPNYYWLFSGGNQGFTTDVAPTAATNGNANLYTEFQTAAGNGQLPSTNFFGAYAENFDTNNPYANGGPNEYVSRHVPWLDFSSINNSNPAGITLDFTNSPLNSSSPSYSANFSNLPVLSFVIPCLTNDMHYAVTPSNEPSGANSNNAMYSTSAIATGDAWLSNNLSAYASWAKSNNSLLIVTWDEDHSADWTTDATNPLQNPSGLTAPNLLNTTNQSTDTNTGPNQIAMIFYGANLATNGPVGTFGANSNGVNNLNLYDTLQSFYGISNDGTQSIVAGAAGLVSAPITDIFAVPEPSAVALFGMSLLLFIPFFRTLRR